MLEKIQDALFLLNVLDTFLENAALGEPSQASELEDRIYCFFVHCVS